MAKGAGEDGKEYISWGKTEYINAVKSLDCTNSDCLQEENVNKTTKKIRIKKILKIIIKKLN